MSRRSVIFWLLFGGCAVGGFGVGVTADLVETDTAGGQTPFYDNRITNEATKIIKDAGNTKSVDPAEQKRRYGDLNSSIDCRRTGALPSASGIFNALESELSGGSGGSPTNGAAKAQQTDLCSQINNSLQAERISACRTALAEVAKLRSRPCPSTPLKFDMLMSKDGKDVVAHFDSNAEKTIKDYGGDVEKAVDDWTGQLAALKDALGQAAAPASAKRQWADAVGKIETTLLPELKCHLNKKRHSTMAPAECEGLDTLANNASATVSSGGAVAEARPSECTMMRDDIYDRFLSEIRKQTDAVALIEKRLPQLKDKESIDESNYRICTDAKEARRGLSGPRGYWEKCNQKLFDDAVRLSDTLTVSIKKACPAVGHGDDY